MDYKKAAQSFKELINKYKRVTIISHIRPDGDTICSALALYNILKNSGIISELICKDKNLPQKYKFIKGFERYKQKIDYTDSLIVTLDCSDLSRVGFNLINKEIVNVDHHKSNTNFGTLNIVNVDVSTTVVLYKLLKEIFIINQGISEALYAGLLSDSQNFTTSLTTKDTFRVASELLEYGVNLSYVSNWVNSYNSLSHTRLISRAIDSLELLTDATVAFMYVTQEDIKATGATFSDIEGIIDIATSLATVELAVLIVELEEIIKVSLRSKNKDISELAVFFGGGGHKNAAGFEVKKSKITTLKYEILDRIKGL